MTTQYLPKAPAEDATNYNSRLQRSVFVNFFLKTVRALAGFVMRKDPVLGEDVPALIKTHCENIDLAGTHLDVFLRQLLQDAITAGHDAILVDFPNTGGRVLRLDEENALRPYWVMIKKDNIMSWRTAIEDGRVVLTQIVLRECLTVADGDFGEREQIQYRVMRRDGYGESAIVSFQVLMVNDRNVVVELEYGICKNQSEIPIAEVSTSGRKGLFESDPPLIDLGFLNISHYQQLSDYVNSMHYTCVPILFTAGFDMGGEGDTEVVVGTNTGLSAQDVNAKAEYVSHDGQALGAIRQALIDMKEDMSALGISMLSPQKKAVESAESQRIGKSDTDSNLAVISRGAQDGAERALGFHAKYLGLASGGSIAINRDFENLQMQSDMLTAFVAAVKDAGLPVRLLLENMQEGGLISPEIDLEDVVDEMMANMQAEADAQAAQAAALAEAAGKNKPAGGAPAPAGGDGNKPPKDPNEE